MQVIEWVEFSLVAGTTDQAFMAASERLQAGFLSRQKGFVRRDLLRSSRGTWADYVVWESHEAAATAMPLAMQSAACLDYFKLLGPSVPRPAGQPVEHFTVHAAY
jgi:hypothetical protein